MYAPLITRNSKTTISELVKQDATTQLDDVVPQSATQAHHPHEGTPQGL